MVKMEFQTGHSVKIKEKSDKLKDDLLILKELMKSEGQIDMKINKKILSELKKRIKKGVV